MLAGMQLTSRQPYRFIGESVLRRWLRHRRISFGSRYRYSNLGYGVLGNVLAKRAGLDYATALRKFVLQPLDLAHTSVTGDSADLIAQPHTALGRRLPAWNMRALSGAGGLHATLADMTRWLQANMAERSPLDARLHTARANSGGKHRSVALAWHVDGEGERRVVWHNGRTGGSSSLIAFAPARGTGVVVLSNSAASVDDLGLRILRHINTPANAVDRAPLPAQTQPIRDTV
jgi:CubicO group peptidase (beta-lactamase class C family)